MRIKDLPLRWILLGAIVIPFAVHRIRLGLRTTEESVRARIEYITGALEARQAKRIRKAVAREFVDESSRYSRRDIVDAARYLTMGSTRYRATLDPVDGVQFLSPPDENAKAVTVRIHCLIDTREREADYEPWWDLEFTADFERQEGTWRVVATRDVNHEDRPAGY